MDYYIMTREMIYCYNQTGECLTFIMTWGKINFRNGTGDD